MPGFPYENVSYHASEPFILHEQRRLFSGSAQVRLKKGQILLRIVLALIANRRRVLRYTLANSV